MSDELIYTSAVRGLRPGSSGFCTVAATAGLGPAWQQRLEGVSGYKALYPVGHPEAGANPVAFAHTILTVAGQTRSVLTRAAFAGADHTGRSNKFVHHLLPTDRERGPGGPAFVLRQPGLMSQSFAGESRPLTAGRAVPTTRPAPAPAVVWQQATGDAAWAAALAAVAIGDPSAIAYVLYAPGTDVLALFDEALRLLPEPRRWGVTFSTYVTEPPAAPCAWRGIVAGTPAAAMAKGTVIDLTNLNPSEVPTGPLAEAARTGRVVTQTATPRNDTASQIKPMPGNVQTIFSPSSNANTAPVAVAASGRAGRPPLPSNVALGNQRTEGAKSKFAAIISIAAAVILLVTAASVGFWLMHKTTVISSSSTSSPTTRSVSAATEPITSPTAKQGGIVEILVDATDTHSKAEEAAEEKLAAEKAAVEKAAADKAAADKMAADQAAADKAAAEKAAVEKAAAEKAAADKMAADQAAADKAAEIEKQRSFPLPPKNNDKTTTWDVRKLPAIKILETTDSNIYGVWPQKPWTSEFKNVTSGPTKSVTFSRKFEDRNFIGSLDGEVLTFTVTIEGSEVKCDFASKIEQFKASVLQKAKEKLKASQIEQLKQVLDQVQANGNKLKITPVSANTYFTFDLKSIDRI